MATRSGDLDPGVVLFLMRNCGLKEEALETLFNHRSGLTAVSEGESDMQALLKLREQGDTKAKLAVDMFVTAVRKAIGAYAATRGGLDLLICTGGIGEHSTESRDLVCDGLDFLKLSADSDRVRLMETEEERQIARICRSLRSHRRLL